MAMTAGLRGAINSAIGDAILTFGWVFCTSALDAATAVVAAALGLEFAGGGGVDWGRILILTAFFAILLLVFDVIAAVLGGASFNPAGNVASYAAGVPGDTLFSMALRFPAQAAGGVGGAIAILEAMPSQYKHTLGGPSIRVDLHTAAMAEGILTFLINLAALVITHRIRAGILVKTWLQAMAIVTLVVSGSEYTGPAMNPSAAFGWAYIKKWHNTWDQFYVYWICPFIGAILAGWLFKFLFSEASKKPKRVPKNKKSD
ncbi:hypothetical protein Cgig2_014062 [Carnegiea gigantea]|uniref:Uncharacterized protein n=1 Tax=Carnegiea gigantea TaxID=171969 RepID=A0A9Q1QT26_9CARY|nr:hypothetical protein Cgig2_014062 [Carnegiea gigantea]